MTGGRRIIKWTLVAVAALILILGGAFFAFLHTFYPSPPEANFPPAADASTAQRQDFAYFRHYLELNRTYTPEALAEARRRLAEYEARAGSLTPAQFTLAIASMTALANSGHARVHPNGMARRHNRLPCRLYRFSDGYYVIRARPACSELLGAKVVKLDGLPIEELADRMYAYFGGPRNHYDQFASPFFLESPELLHAAELALEADRVSVRAILQDGSEREIEIAADAPNPDAPAAYGNEFLSPERFENESADWKPLFAVNHPLPIFLHDFAIPFRAEYWRDRGIYYLQFRSNADEPGHPIGEFVERARRDIISHRPRVIVLDLRFDQGGNFTSTASLMKKLTTLTDSVEHVYVLTSGWTFSAGNVSLALAKDRGGAKVTVIGEPVGDGIRIWAEGGTLRLPNSKLGIGFATGLHDYSHSCWGERGCFWVMYFYPTHVATLEPDVRVQYSFADYKGGRDPMLERALDLAGGRSP